ncbi:hypothetical protein VTK73DRAFT_2436 [Phialemonium thermophilum]|uniref:PEBP-like protein n=1 Tax=Phialemonium thermophilum TaxID=223376 RepID=A0ABR3X555_9PEZI
MMMLSKSMAVVVSAASMALAKTPSGFEPASNSDLIVEFSNLAALNGAVVSKEASAKQPQIGTTTRLTGTSFAVIMVDLDIPTTNPPATNTLLHWMQTGLTPALTATSLNTTSGRQSVFLLENQGNTPALAPYIGPSPPARVPLSHRYTQILVDTSGVNTEATNALQMAAMNRQGFNAQRVLQQAGLQDKVVAGNFFVVTNPGPAQTGGSSDNATSVATGTSSLSGPSGTAVTISGSDSISRPHVAVFGLVVAGVLYVGF